MPFDNLFADAQADARARELLGRVEPLKDDENAFEVLRRDPDAIVSHGKFPKGPLALAANVDFHRGFPAELEGVAHEVLEQLREQAQISLHRRERVTGDFGASLL